MTIDEILNQYRSILQTRFDLFINDSRPYVLLIAVTFTFVFVGYKVMRAMSDPDEKIGRDTLLRPILTLMAITLYIPLVKLLLFDKFTLNIVLTLVSFITNAKSLLLLSSKNSTRGTSSPTSTVLFSDLNRPRGLFLQFGRFREAPSTS